jgi:putative flippase GtrA
MAPRISRGRIVEIWRYYQAGIVNTVFGLTVYSLFVWLGVNIFLAQLVAQIIGVAFNYLTYSGHVFRAAGPAKLRFVLSYVVGYFIALGTLAIVSRVVQSPYLAGAISALVVSVLNYFILRNLVFRTRAA